MLALQKITIRYGFMSLLELFIKRWLINVVSTSSITNSQATQSYIISKDQKIWGLQFKLKNI